MRPDRPRAVNLSIADVTPSTRWVFVEVETKSGLRGVGEATLSGCEAAVADAAARLAPMVLALAESHPTDLVRPTLADLPEAAAFSALDQALWDIEAQRKGVPLAEVLGTPRRDRIPVYANINRRTGDRSPAAFAASAGAAVLAGHTSFKTAPFDEVTTGARSIEAIAPGLRRIAAVRDRVGHDSRLMIDCHWRLDEASAEYVIAAAAEMGVHWVECPLPETPEHIETLARLRASANRRGIRLAGLETGIGVDGFLPFVRAGAYDVMMPDIKYVGGLMEVLRLADVLRQAGIGFAPHNPSGPVCHAVSLHVCAVTEALHSLETQFDETPLFGALVGTDLQHTTDGTMPVPGEPGAGVMLRQGPLERCRSIHWTITRDGKQ